MMAVALLVLALGFVISTIGFIWYLVVAFKEHVLWGLGSIFFWPVIFAFVVNYWEDSKKPFLLHVGGLLLMILSMAFVPSS
ncbi:MAG: hypothetical protein ACOCVR_05085 [Myxococcota bacterium]